MDILSASTYPIPSPASAKRANFHGSQARVGVAVLGYVREDEHAQAQAISNEGEPTRNRTKKRARSDEDELSKKQRGRPRLDTQDETAADRRRTQIRLAQRAYRMRKETTISALKKKILQLESTIDQMNRSFVHFSDNVMESGALVGNAELAQELRATTKQFLQLAKTICSDSDREEDAIEEIKRGKSPETADEHHLVNSPQKSSWTPDEEVQPERHALLFENDFGQSEQSSGQNGPQVHASAPTSTNVPDLMRYQQWNLEVPEAPFLHHSDLEIERPLRQPRTRYTYSFQETTFARRLHRASIERGFRLLTNPMADQDEISYAFRFTFCFTNRKRIVIRFQELLQRTAGESLENWNVPYFRVGGAGMHYPRVGKDGNISYPPNIHSPARAFGPMLFTTPETPREEQTTDRLLQAIGFGGTWFDSHDVESYLQEKGIRLSAQSSFVDIDASLLSPPSLTVDSNSQEPSAPPSRESPSPWVNQLEGVPHLMQASFNDDGLLPQGPILDNGIGQHEKVGDLSHWSEGRSSAAIDNWRQQVKQISGQLITIDVDRFLEHVTSKSVCLGRAPGFRQSDVDEALRSAVQEVY